MHILILRPFFLFLFAHLLSLCNHPGRILAGTLSLRVASRHRHELCAAGGRAGRDETGPEGLSTLWQLQTGHLHADLGCCK